MNLDFDFSAVPRFFRGVATELRQKRLWPVAAVLVLALIAIPVLLSNSGSAAPQPVAQLPAAPPPSGNSIPALNVQSTTTTHSRLRGTAHDPFAAGSPTTTTPQLSTSTATSPVTTAVATATSNPGGASSGGASSGASNTSSTASSGGGAAGSSSSGSSATPTSNPPSITPNAKPKPAPSGLTSKQAYDVELAMTNSAGGIDTTDPLTRLSVLPSPQQALLVELGVLRGGKRVVFAVQPGTAVNGPGTCVPGPLDCEILELGQDQTEQLSARTGSLTTSQVALFAVTGISAMNYPSTAAADAARRAHSDAGKALIDKSSSSALSLFMYDPSLGSIVDLRNLGVS
jgi:hypothetical protein